MGTSKQHGFTIIEVMLFLGVSGMLIVMLLVGTTGAINRQRYTDAVQSFRSLLQAQYTDLSSVENSRDNTWSCDSTGAVTEGGPATEYRGQGTCVLVGKYVRIDKDDIRTYTVVAYPKASPTQNLSDIASLKANYTLAVTTSDIQRDSLDWGTQIAFPVSGVGSQPSAAPQLGLLFLRSPDSGTVYTFTSNNIPMDPNVVGQNDFNDLIVAGNATPNVGQSARTICIVSNGLVKSGNTAVYIKAYASSTGSIETRSNEFMATLPEKQQC